MGGYKMKREYRIAEDRYQELVNDTYSFIFIEVDYGNMRVPSIILTVKSVETSSVTIEIETIYGSPQGLTRELRVVPSQTEVDIHIIEEDDILDGYMGQSLRKKLRLKRNKATGRVIRGIT